MTLLGYSIPLAIVQQALLGIFGGICAILIVLSIGAAIACRINMSKRHRHKYSAAVKNYGGGSSSTTTGGAQATTTVESNTSGDHEEMFMSSSASASPGSGKGKSFEINN